LASGNGTAPQTVNGHATRAERRRVQNNTPMPGAVGAAEQTLAQVIGETVALHLAQMLGQVLARMPYLGECARCIRSAKLGIRAYEVKVANAQQAAEPVPERPAPPEVARAVTWQDGEPVCFGCYRLDGPEEWTPEQVEQFGAELARSAVGRPIVRSGG
jgi:bacterioferritin-associated ferredoxin